MDVGGFLRAAFYLQRGGIIFMPRVSVILPVFNGMPDLAEAMNSLRDQDYSDFEIVAIDDGSTDDTARFLERVRQEDDRLRIITHPSNRGLIDSLNHGLGAARGEFIARQDADDLSLPGRLGAQVAAFDAEPTLGLLATAYIARSREGESIRYPPVTHGELRWCWLFGNVWMHGAVMLRASLVAGDNEGYRNFPLVEDYELWSRLAKHHRSATLREPLAVRRWRPSGISARNRSAQLAAVYELSGKLLSDLAGIPLSASRVAALHRVWSGTGLRHGDLAEVPMLLGLFGRLGRQPFVEGAVLSTLRTRWIRRLLARAPSDVLGSNAASWRPLLREAPLAVGTGLLLDRWRPGNRSFRARDAPGC